MRRNLAKRKRSHSAATTDVNDALLVSETERHGNIQRSKSMVCFAFLFEYGTDYLSQLQRKKTNPIYLYYERVLLNTKGKKGEEGDMHYKCLHGNHKVMTITKKMKYLLNGRLLQFSMHKAKFSI